jgi:transketolase
VNDCVERLAPLDAAAATELHQRAKRVRRSIVRMIHEVGTGHSGPSLSMVEILVLLYFRHLRVRPSEPSWPNRDRVVLSKGHGAPGLYAVLVEAGYFEHAELSTLRKLGSRLQGHPKADVLPGIDFSTGSLGQGLSVALGIALGMERLRMSSRVFCILGDGELQEGQNWEAAMAAAAFKANRLTAIVDRNGLQGDGRTESVMPLEPLAAKWSAFGWHVQAVPGHDYAALDAALLGAHANGKPSVIVAETTKGRGVGFMEGKLEWHHHPIDAQQLASALSDIESM